MVRKFLLLLLGLLPAGVAKCQNVPATYNFPDSVIKNARYPSEDVIGQDLSISGYYQLGLIWDDKRSPPIPADNNKQTVLNENALAQIVRLAKNARVVLINEGHNLPNSRCFVLQVLQALKPLGFNAYGAETLMWHDTTLAQRGYPVDTTGYYTREPVFGEVVRDAIKMGYALFPYEDSVHYVTQKVNLDTLGSFMVIYPQSHDTSRMIVKPNGDQIYYMGKADNYREINQAANIMNYLRTHPGARAVIHVGYGHLCRDADGSLMGFYLDTALAGNLISINQESLREHSDTAFEEPFYRQRHFTDYTAFTDSAGKPVMPAPPKFCKVDVTVAHPRTRYINGRPDWLYKMPGCKTYTTAAFSKIKAPSVLVAYYAAEYNASQQHAVPVDVLELTAPANNPPLLLRKGLFTIIQIGEHGQKMRYDVTVE